MQQQHKDLPTPLQHMQSAVHGVRLTTHCMDPTARYIVKPGEPGYGTQDYEVGGVVFCGDPATKPGNEARVQHWYQKLTHWIQGKIGYLADSSDDPAQMYAMAQPSAFDPEANSMMLEQVMVFETQKSNHYTVQSLDGTAIEEPECLSPSAMYQLKGSIIKKHFENKAHHMAYYRLYWDGLKKVGQIMMLNCMRFENY